MMAGARVRSLAFAGVLATLLSIGLLTSCRTATVALPNGVTKRCERVELTGKVVKVDCYFSDPTRPAPAVVVAHGFSRNRKNMAGWGGMLAANGFIVAVPDLPWFTHYGRNSRAINELLTKIQSGDISGLPPATKKGVLIGHSMGAMSTLMAAAKNSNVVCWVGLDAVNMGRAGMNAATALRIPSVILRAEPQSWNRQGNGRSILPLLSGSVLALKIKGATHCDPEHPSDALGEFFCGKTDPLRRDIFQRYALNALQSVCFGDQQAYDRLAAAKDDVQVAEVQMRNLTGFRSSF